MRRIGTARWATTTTVNSCALLVSRVFPVVRSLLQQPLYLRTDHVHLVTRREERAVLLPGTFYMNSLLLLYDECI